jgi:hypothetical protein
MGVSDLVAAREPLEDMLGTALLDSGYENLTIMTCGRSNTDPAALLSKSRFPQLIYLLKQRFDMVVLDSAPTIAGADPVFLAEVSDGVVIVVSARRTTMSGLKRTVTSLREAQDVHILGVVFNRVRLQITSKYSNTYYQQVPGMNSSKLTQELLKPSRSPLNLRASVIEGQNGERYYSVSACATRLGVKEKTVREWCSTGYLKAQRRPIRLWVKESDIDALIKRLPVHETREVSRPLTVAEEIPVLAPQPSRGGDEDVNRLPDQLREQRAALLDFVNKPNHSDLEQNSNQH